MVEIPAKYLDLLQEKNELSLTWRQSCRMGRRK